jgi:hypothetical protein
MAALRKSSTLAALLALLVCVGVMVAFGSAVPAPGAQPHRILTQLQHENAGSSLLVRPDQARHAQALAKVLAAPPAALVVAPVPVMTSAPAFERHDGYSQVFAGVQAGRSPPFFSC